MSAFLYRLAIALWVGGAALFTFVLTPAIFKSYDRDTAGGFIGVLFPGYFKWGLACGVIALAAIILAPAVKSKPIASIMIAAMLAVTAAQAFVIEPRATALKKEIPSFETTPEDHPLRVQFKKLHALSAAGNLAVIGGGIVLIALL